MIEITVASRDYANAKLNTVEPGYNDIVLYYTSSISSDILWYQFLTVNHNIIILGYNDTRL